MYACFLVLIKVEAEHVSFVLMVVFQIIHKLSNASLIVFIAMPDFQFHDELLARIIHNDIRPPCVPGLRFDVIIPNAVDNRLFHKFT